MLRSFASFQRDITMLSVDFETQLTQNFHKLDKSTRTVSFINATWSRQWPCSALESIGLSIQSTCKLSCKNQDRASKSGESFHFYPSPVTYLKFIWKFANDPNHFLKRAKWWIRFMSQDCPGMWKLCQHIISCFSDPVHRSDSLSFTRRHATTLRSHHDARHCNRSHCYIDRLVRSGLVIVRPAGVGYEITWSNKFYIQFKFLPKLCPFLLVFSSFRELVPLLETSFSSFH